jgi:hypothetical protein
MLSRENKQVFYFLLTLLVIAGGFWCIRFLADHAKSDREDFLEGRTNKFEDWAHLEHGLQRQ